MAQAIIERNHSFQGFAFANEFLWSMNTQGEGWRTIVQSESTLPPTRAFSSSTGSVSAVTVRTNGPNDYGTVTCNARNDRGWMAKPCVFETVPSEETLAVLVIGGHNVRG